MKKRIAFLLSAVLLMGTLAGCGGGDGTKEPAPSSKPSSSAVGSKEASSSSTEPAASTSEEPTSAETPLTGKNVVVGCSATFVPYESIVMDNSGNKDHVGMNIDIVKALVEKNGGTVEFTDMPFKSLMAAIQAKQIDFCIGGMAPTDERRKTLDFSEIYFYPRNAIVYKEDQDFPTLDSLKGKKIAYVFGTNYQQVAESVEDAETVGIQGSPACIEEVKSGRADACIVDGAGAAEFLKTNTGLKMSLLDKTDDCFAIGFPKDSPYYETLNNTLKEMMENGELDEIIKQHLNEQFILD